jgi:hypothetical protein
MKNLVPTYHITLNQAIGKSKTFNCTVCDDFVVLQEILETNAECNCK